MASALIIFLVVWAAFVATAMWEARVEGRNTWDKGKLGWKIMIKGRAVYTAYQFWLFMVMYPLLMIILPLIVNGWNVRLFGILVSAYFSGVALEDIVYPFVNPAFKWKEKFHSKLLEFRYYKIAGIKVPIFHIVHIIIAVLVWYFLWR